MTPPARPTALTTQEQSFRCEQGRGVAGVAVVIYSPSRGGTLTWLECPRKWDFSKRWTVPERPRPELWIGTAMHKGLEAHYGAHELVWGTHRSRAATPSDCQEIMDFTLAELWQETPLLSLERAQELVYGAYQEAVKLNVVGQAKIVAVEQAMGEEQCHPDLVLQLGETLSVVDWKFTYSCSPEYVATRLKQYEVSWQLWHYAWRVQQEFKLPVTHYTVVLVIGMPKVVAKRIDVSVFPEALTTWERGARGVWQRMHEMELQWEPAWPNYHACLKYGGCPFYTGCHILAADESRFEGVYQRVEPV